MAGAKDKDQDKVWVLEGVDLDREDVVFLDGFAIPSKLTVRVKSSPGGVNLTVDAELEGDRAWPRRVEVSTDRPGGVTSTVLRDAAVRTAMLFGYADTVQRVELVSGKPQLRSAKGDEEARELVKRLVGYAEITRDAVVSQATVAATTSVPTPKVRGAGARPKRSDGRKRS
jgi:hypothetical protein